MLRITQLAGFGAGRAAPAPLPGVPVDFLPTQLGTSYVDGLKPAMWGFAPALANPEWRMLHHGASVPRALLAMWEGGGQPYDLVSGRAAVIDDPQWITVGGGHAIDQQAASTQIIRLRADDSDLEFLKDDTAGMCLVVFSLPAWTIDHVIFSVGEKNTNNNSADVFTSGTSGELRLEMKTGATMQWQFDIGGLSLGKTHALVFGSDGAGNFAFLDGGQPSPSYLVGTASTSAWLSGITAINAWGLGQFAKGSIVLSGHDIVAFGQWGAVPSRGLARALSADPFGPFRMNL